MTLAGVTTRGTATTIAATATNVIAIATMMPGLILAVARVPATTNQSPTCGIATMRAGPSGIAIRETTIRVTVTGATSSCAISTYHADASERWCTTRANAHT